MHDYTLLIITSLFHAVTPLRISVEDTTSVRLTLNPLCHDHMDYIVPVFLGMSQQGGDAEYAPQQNITTCISPGDSVILSVDTAMIMLDSDQEYCSPTATSTPTGEST